MPRVWPYGSGSVSGAVNSHHRQTIGHSVSALHNSPCFALAFLLLGRIAAFVADGRGVNQQFCTAQCHEACSFGIPLVPAHLYAQTTNRGVNGLEAHIAGREIELFVVSRVVGDVHFAVFSGNGSVSFEHYCRVVIQTGCATFE